jgi:hypothetical protein
MRLGEKLDAIFCGYRSPGFQLVRLGAPSITAIAA